MSQSQFKRTKCRVFPDQLSDRPHRPGWFVVVGAIWAGQRRIYGSYPSEKAAERRAAQVRGSSNQPDRDGKPRPRPSPGAL